jgi:hypothetical protein
MDRDELAGINLLELFEAQVKVDICITYIGWFHNNAIDDVFRRLIVVISDK